VRPRSRFARTTFSFDLALPQTYLAAERVDHLFPGVRWQPAYASAVWDGPAPMGALLARAEDRAAALGAPLILPEPLPAEVRPAMRLAALACERGRGAAFVLAAGRLAFCGGFDLGDPEVLAEAAAAAGLPLDACLAAAGDAARDAAIEEAGRRLAAGGATELPALRVGRRLFSGEERLPEAMAAATASA
jgi:2-hydroxychromene-2-carboxylate isomerase